MAVWDKKILMLWGFVFLLAGAVGQSVNYPHPVCAMKGSTVTLPCTFETLESVTENGKEVVIKINRVVWCPNHLICQLSTPSVYDSESINNNPRYRYLGDKKGNCTLQITNLRMEDEATFRFRVETNHSKATFTGQAGVKVTVIDFNQMKIKPESSIEFKRGETLTLTCTAMCTFHQLEVTWFRDGNILVETGPTLQLGPLAAKDSGNYTCGLKINNVTLSQPYSLHVEAEEEGGVSLPLIAGVVVGVLLVLFALVLVLCIIKRKRAAAAAGPPQPSVDGEQKHPDIIYSNIRQPAQQEPQEDISYAAVHFKQKNQSRPAEKAEDNVIYSSVASRG